MLDFKFIKPLKNNVKDLSRILASNRNLAALVHIEAISPPGAGGDFIPLYTGTYNGRPIYIPSRGVLGKIARTWVNAYNRRGSNPDSLYSGLLVFVTILNRTALKLHDLKHAHVYSTVDVISYKPAAVARGMTLKYSISVTISPWHQGLRYTLNELKGLFETMPIREFSNKPKTHEGSYYALQPQSPEDSWYCDDFSDPVASYCWRREIYISPENLTALLPSTYFRWDNGKLYMKTPLMIVYNKYGYSDVVTANINLGAVNAAVSVYAVFGLGDNLVELFRGETSAVPELTLWRSGGRIWGGERYYYSRAESIPPEHWWWAWIWGRPVFAVYREYYCVTDCEPTGSSVAIAAVTDVITSGNIIEGGEDKEQPPSVLLDNILRGVNLNEVDVLYPGDSLPLGTLFETYDTCGADFEIGIPVGAIVGDLLGGPAGAAVGSAFTASLSAEGSRIHIMGGIENEGYYGVSEPIYVGVSKLRYSQEQCWLAYCQRCYYNVPIGLYIESR